MKRAFLVILGLSGCAGSAGSPSTGSRSAQTIVARGASVAGGRAAWTYEVQAGPAGAELSVQATLSAGSSAELSVADGAERFVRDVEVKSDASWRPVAETKGSWAAPECRAQGCRLRYRFLLREAAAALDEVSSARRHGDAIEAAPSTWLLRPLEPAPGATLRFHVTSAPGDAFVSGVYPVGGASDTYEAPASLSFQLAYSAFGRLRIYPVEGQPVTVAITPGTFEAGDPTIVAWVAASAGAVAQYYQRFPVAHLLVLVTPGSRGGVGFGTTMGGGGASISIAVGRSVDSASLRDDWVLVHEMVHTALPDVLGPQHWLEEGLATYAEPLVRGRAGILTDDELWAEWVRSMPNGLPRAGDEGLDTTHTWGRTYWGGALFCLVADVEIRERTHNTRSLDDALRGILKSGGNISVAWDIARITAAGDAATGVPVLTELYATMAHTPATVDLAGLWRRLGIAMVSGRVVFDDRAPLADVRRAMTAKTAKNAALATPPAPR